VYYQCSVLLGVLIFPLDSTGVQERHTTCALERCTTSVILAYTCPSTSVDKCLLKLLTMTRTIDLADLLRALDFPVWGILDLR